MSTRTNSVPLGCLRLLWQHRAFEEQIQTGSWSDPGWSSAAGGRSALRPDPLMPQQAGQSNWPTGSPRRMYGNLSKN